MKKQSLTQMAKRANGRSRMCGKCPFHLSASLVVCEICSKAFVEGYEKGYRQRLEEEDV